jgi:SAM-dependent methyltransferase
MDRDYLKKEFLILEVGCGKNRSLEADIAVDIRKESLCDIIADAHYLPFKDGLFCKVIMYQVLEHLSHPEKALKEINRVLRKKGELEFSIPNAFYLGAIIRWIINRKMIISPEHINCWRLPEIENLLRRTGFIVSEVSFIDTHFHKPLVFADMLPRVTKHSMLIKSKKSEVMI